MQRPGRGQVAAALGTLWLVGGLVYPLLAIASDGLTPMQVTAIRTTAAAALTTPLLLARLRQRRPRLLERRSLAPNLVAGLLFYPVGNGLLTFASARLPSSTTALAFSLLPVLAAVATAMRGQVPRLTVWVGIGGALTSMLVVVGAPGRDASPAPVLAALASVACWFSGTEYWAARRAGTDLVASIWLQLVVGSLGCWVALVATDAPLPALGAWLQPVMLVLAFSQFIQHAAYLGVAGRVSAVALTSFAFVNPVVAAVAGFLLLDQAMTTLQLVASACLLASVLLVIRVPSSALSPAAGMGPQ